ncbi:MAG TPA: phage tail sheath subtilisin-like domain-containing protein, partial [Roseiflexaceae bacterium]|nr:phage tail sheath subtilisin-like domain-containing protein [Roseiflexaceae bacterium]
TGSQELCYAVRGFFENGGRLCYVLPYSPSFLVVEDMLRAALAASETLADVDLVCAPDVQRFGGPRYSRPALDPALQRIILEHCRASGHRFALLDSSSNSSTDDLLDRREQLEHDYGALYAPWLVVQAAGGAMVTVPPCGHVAGIYARSDLRTGVHKAPANESVAGAVDVVCTFDAADEVLLARNSVNYLRPFAGRGIRVWGAWTLSGDPAWRYVPVRRLFQSVARWLELFMAQLAFEDNDVRLWARILRELSAYFDGLYRRGALQGMRPEQGYYIKCDAETNTAERIARGEVVTEIGLAPTIPGEFIVARIVHSAGGVSISDATG